MAGSISNYGEDYLLNYLLTGTRHVGLFTDASGMSNDQPSAEATTGNCPGYTRQSVTFAASSGGIKASAAPVTFTATGTWATVRYVGVWDAATAGNLLFWASITDKTLANTDQLKIESGQLSLSLD